MTTLEKIRAEIQKVLDTERDFTSENAKAQAIALMWVLELFDKYAEQEPSEDMTIAYLMGYYADKEPKTGHWIKKQSGVWTHNYECSECGGMVLACEVDLPDYCGHCGARMESEDADT